MKSYLNNFKRTKQIVIGLLLFQFSLILLFSCSKDSKSPVDGSTTPDEPYIWQEHVFERQQLTSNIYIISEDYGGNKVNITVLTGDDGKLLIDSGYPDVCQMLKDSIQQINSDSIKYIINTHYHVDHKGGNSIIDDNGTIIGHDSDSFSLRFANPDAQVITFTDEYRLDFNNEAIECYTTPQIGHLSSEIIIYFSTSNVLFLGDLYLPVSFPSISVQFNNATVQNWIANIDSIATQFPSDVIIVPGHGQPSTMDEFIAYTDLMKKTVDIVISQINMDKTYEEIVEDDVLADWREYGTSLQGLTTEFWIRAIYDSYGGE